MQSTIVDRIERSLRETIVNGGFAPDSRLRVQALVEQYEAGATPVREALCRLAGEGLVELTANRGFRAPGMSRADLTDLVTARTAVELEALRLSMLDGDDHWEARIVAALYRFRRRVEADEKAESATSDASAHDDLHRAIVSACNAPRLLRMQEQLLDQHKRYQRLGNIRYTAQEHIREHVELSEVILSRNVDAALSMMRQHLRLSLDALDRRGFWKEPQGAADAAALKRK